MVFRVQYPEFSCNIES